MTGNDVPLWKEVDVMLFYKKERAQGMVEYALIILLIVIVCVALITVIGTAVSGMYSKIVVVWPAF